MRRDNKFEVIGFDVDTQRDFMETREDNPIFYQGKLKIDNAMSIAPSLERLTNCLVELQIPIFGSVDWHDDNAKEFGENPDFFKKFPSHCVKGTYGSEKINATRPLDPLWVDYDFSYDVDKLVGQIRKHSGEVFFRKDNFDVFKQSCDVDQGVGNPYASCVLEKLGVKKAVVYGVATDVCVNYAVKGLRGLGIEVYAVRDCMAGLNFEEIEQKMKEWQTGDNPAKIVSLDEIVGGKYLN